MKKIIVIMAVLAIAGAANAATEQQKQAAIDAGLAWLADTQTESGSEGYWSYTNSGTLATTGSAALAFIEEGYLPGSDVIIDTGSGPVNYGDVVGRATNYIFNRATAVTMTGQTMGHPEDYNNDGTGDGNSQGIYFNPGDSNRNVYTTGIVAPVVYALGEALGRTTVVGAGVDLDGDSSTPDVGGFAPTSGVAGGMTYEGVMQDVIDWYSWGQVDPAYGNHRGGWRYNANYTTSDNSTAQWGALPMLYGDGWDLTPPQFVKDELNLYADYIQNTEGAGSWRNGGSGYDTPSHYVNMAKTGGLMLELAAIGAPVTDPRVQAALGYMQSTVSFDHWNQPTYTYYSGTSDQWWGGHLNNPYAMWAVYKALETYGITTISTAPGGFTIGQEWDPGTSAAGDWYAQYCDYLVGIQNGNGSWSGSGPFAGALATGWYINILNATGVPEPVDPVPVPGAFLLGSLGLAFSGWKIRRRKEA